MRQVDIYKQALGIMREAEYLKAFRAWGGMGRRFSGLCKLVYLIEEAQLDVIPGTIEAQFLKDSRRLTGRHLYGWMYWFTDIKENELKARQERIEHLEKLIKLYES